MLRPDALARLTDGAAPWRWKPNRPAAPDAIARLARAAPAPLPAEYLDLLRATDGGEGALGLAPLWLVLWSADEVVRHGMRSAWPGLLAIGTNGGGETIAFDVVPSGPWPVVSFDPRGSADSVRRIASDAAAFVAAIGLDAPD